MKKILLSIGVVLTSLTLNAQANLSFEFWSSGAPTSWSWFGLPANILANPGFGGTCTANGVPAIPCVQGTTGAPEGSSYVKLTAVTRAGSDDAQLDGVFGGTISQSYASFSQPASFSFQYKYARQNNDTAAVVFQATKWNGTDSDVVGVGRALITGNASSWTTVTDVPITWTGISDTVTLILTTSKGDIYSSSMAPQDNSIFEVDALSINTGSTASITDETQSVIRIYPNPVNAILNIESDEEVASVVIMATDGKIVLTSDSKNIEVAELTNGMYIYQITTASGKISKGNFVKN